MFYRSEYDNGDDDVMVLLTDDGCVSDNNDDDGDDKDIEKIRYCVEFGLSS